MTHPSFRSLKAPTFWLPTVAIALCVLPQEALAQRCLPTQTVGQDEFVFNGNFEFGNVGFANQLPYRGDNTYPDDPIGGYSILSGDFIPGQNGFSGVVDPNPFPGDPTTGTPASNTYLYSNPNEQLGIPGSRLGLDFFNPVVWEQNIGIGNLNNSIALVPGTYSFLAYFDNLLVPGTNSVEPRIVLQVESASEGIFNSVPVPIPESAIDWTAIEILFTVTDPTATLRIIDQANNAVGDDFGMTATSVRRCIDSVDLAVTKTDTPDPVLAGDLLTYTIALENLSPNDAFNVTLSDALPAQTTFFALTAPPGWSCTDPGVGNSGTISCNHPLVPANSATNFTVQVSVNANLTDGATFTNNANVTSIAPDLNLNNNVDAETTTVRTAANLVVTKTDTPDPVVAGDNLTYTVTVENQGPNTAVNAEFRDTLPPATTFQSLTAPPGWTCTDPGLGNGGTVACTNPSLASGSVATFTLTVAVDATTPDNTDLDNTAIATSDTPDPDDANNSDTVTTTVQTTADLRITKTDTPDPAIAGESLTYTLTAEHRGTSLATNVEVSDTLPPEMTFQSLTAPPGWTCTDPGVGNSGTITCTRPTFVEGDVATFTVTVDLAETIADGTVLTNTATITSDIPDPNPDNNDDSEDTTIEAIADLSITKVDDRDPINAGNLLTYTLTARNDGPSAAANVEWTDPLPAQTRFQSLVIPAGWTCTDPGVGNPGSLNCTAPTLANGAIATFTVAVIVDPTTPDNTVIANPVEITADTPDPNADNNRDTEETAVGNRADLSVLKTDTADPVAPGETLTYTVTVANAGPNDALNTVWVDPLPPETRFQSLVVPSGWSCTDPGIGNTGNVSCTHPNFAAGSTQDFVIAVIVDRTTPNDTTLTNPVSITSDIPDTDRNNNQDTEDTLITSTPRPLIGVAKSAGIPQPIAEQAGVYDLPLTVVVENLGNLPLTNVQLLEDLATVLADATQFSVQTAPTVTLTGTGSASGNVNFNGRSDQNLLSPGASLNPGDRAAVTFTLRVEPGRTLTYRNTVLGTGNTPTGDSIRDRSQSGDQPDPDGDGDPSNNNDPTPISFNESDLRLSKTVDSSNPNPGDLINFTVTLTNDGPDAATNIEVRDRLPASLANATFRPSLGRYDEVTGIWSIPRLAIGASAELRVRGRFSDPLTNTAEVISVDQFDPDSTPNNNDPSEDDQASVSVPAGVADLSLTKRVDIREPQVGDRVMFTLTLRNDGPDAATNVTVTDVIPAGLNDLSVAASQGAYNPDTGDWILSRLENGDRATLVITARFEGSTAVENIAEVTAADQRDPDSIPNNNNWNEDDQDRAELIGRPNLTLFKRITAVNRAGVTTRFDQVVGNPPNDAIVGVEQIPATDPLRSGDQVEYTIYFLSDGTVPAESVQVCDLIPDSTTYRANSLRYAAPGSSSLEDLSDRGDRDPGTFFSPLAPLPNPHPCEGDRNPNGAVMVDVGDVRPIPGENLGFIRFWTTIP